MSACVKITADNVTDAQIESLRREAANYGDADQADLCDLALTETTDYNRFEVRSARIKCARAIDNARAMDES